MQFQSVKLYTALRILYVLITTNIKQSFSFSQRRLTGLSPQPSSFVLLSSATSFSSFARKSRRFVSTMSKNGDMKLILGSGSSSRRFILDQAGYTNIEICKPDIDERAIGDRSIGTFENAKDIVLELGNAKADAILTSYQQKDEISKANILITADQIILCNHRILEKPENVLEAKEFMTMYNSHPCQTIGSIVLTDMKTNKRVSGVDTASIYFKTIPTSIMDTLIEDGEAMYCAGGLMIEHTLIQPYIDHIEGNQDSVMGFSMDLFEALLHQLGSNHA